MQRKYEKKKYQENHHDSKYETLMDRSYSWVFLYHFFAVQISTYILIHLKERDITEDEVSYYSRFWWDADRWSVCLIIVESSSYAFHESHTKDN